MYPFFILGNPRSGTSLFRLMLNSNPNIVVPPECGFALWLKDNSYINSASGEVDFERFSNDVLACKKIETWGIEKTDLLKVLKNRNPKSYSDLVCCVYLAYAEKFSKFPEVAGDKNNYYINEVDSLNHCFPFSKKVFIVRDVRDVACSYIELEKKKIASKYRPNLSSSMTKIAEEWSNNARTLLEEYEKGGCIYIKYESLINNPSVELEKICSFLEVPYSTEMLDYYKKNDEPSDFMQWKKKTLQRPCSSSIGRYKKELSTKQVLVLEEYSKLELNALNYEV